MSIPASDIVSIVPSVISAGGSGLTLQGLLLSSSTQIPMGTILSFPSALSGSNYFGASSTEAAAIAIYFKGFNGSNIRPASVLMAQYPTTARSAFLRGASVASLTLVQLQALSGTLIISVNGSPLTSATISLSGAASFSAAAALIQAGFTTPTFAVTYDSVSGGFVFTSTLTGAAATIGYCTGTLSTGLLLTQATGAVISQGADIAVPGTFMAGIVAQTVNFASFCTLFNPDVTGNANKLLFQAWNNTQNDSFVYAAWDTDVTPTTSNAATTSFGYLIKAINSSGCFPVWGSDYTKAVFACGLIASIDFTQKNGRTTAFAKSQTGLSIDVTDYTVKSNLIANGYNCYADWATANQSFIGLTNGGVSGPYKWLDSYVDQIWLTNGLQLALMTLLFGMKSIPYNAAGYELVRAACLDPITAAVNFGAINAGVPLSALQAAEVNNAAGLAIDGILSTQGWYLQILPATAITRGNRASPPISLWYVDGGSIQQINLASIEVQ